MEQEKTKKILVVDDEEKVREVVSRLLESCGFRVSVAEDASEALDVFSTELFDMVITDVKMPGEFSGIDLLKIIKAGFDIPVIVMSGYGTMDTVLASMRYGACDFLPKPLDRDYLVSLVKENLKDTNNGAREYKLEDLSYVAKFELENTFDILDSLRTFVVDSVSRLGLGEMRASSLWVAAREAIRNAMIHGNKMQEDKLVSLVLWNAPREISVVVADEGTGFCHGQVQDQNKDTERHHMQGLELIRSLADDVKFNDKGNEIRLVFLK